MQIGLINITNLTRVRDTFKPGRRIMIAITFLLSVFLWWAALHQLRSLTQIVDDPALRMRTLILAAVILIPLVAALFHRNDFARLFFALATTFNLATITLLMLLIGIYFAGSARGAEQVVSFIFLIGLLFLWAHQIFPCYVLILSVMPFGRWKAYRQQVNYSLRLWSGQWKDFGESQAVGAGEKPYFTQGAYYRLALGGLSFAIGVLIISVGFFSILNVEFLPAVYHLELSKAWDMLANLRLKDSTVSDMSIVVEMTNTLLMLLLGFFFFFIFGYFWTQWQRENVLVYRTPLLQHMTSSDLLLLRSFSDDVKFVNRKIGIWTLIFRMYGWSFTFEQLIVNRLKYLGQVRLLDMEQEREALLSKRGIRFIAEILGADRLRKLLISVLPAVWYKLPAQGGVRYYIEAPGDVKKWQKEIGKAMSLARVIVVLLGTTESLKWEMCRIEQLRLMEKTLFVMPPLIRKKSYRARWRQFIDIVSETHEYDRRLLEKVNPKRVLAVIVRASTLVIITGKHNSQRFYESALDVATIFTVTDPAQSVKMIPKYLE